MSLRDHGFGRKSLREGGGRGTGDDHVDGLFGSVELSIYQTPNTRPKGFETLKAFVEAQDCELVFTHESPPELSRHETLRITNNKDEPIPLAVVKRAHRWAPQRNYLHSFFRPMYR